MKNRMNVCIRDHVVSAGVSALLISVAACGAPEPEAPPTATQAEVEIAGQPRIAQTQEDWHAAMRELAVPAKGCFTSEFPRIAWREVPCAKPPDVPYPPARGRRPFSVGNGTDFVAHPSGLISAAEGSFDTVSGVTSIDSAATGGVSEFSLQLNTSFFTTPACSSDPSCRGWEQFVYSNTGSAFIQYWMINYNTTCPAGWNTFGGDCWKNSATSVTVGHQSVSDLGGLKLGGSAVLGGLDTITMVTPAGSMSATANDSELSLAAGWTDAEFNIFGDCCFSDATFNAGSTVTVHTTVHNGTTAAPSCVIDGFTGETNNLTLVGTPAMGPFGSPAIVFNQSNVTPFTARSCASAMGTGDPHLTTFRGLYYDFQGRGDYLLAQRGPDFVVQTRQISGAPTWPNAAVNKAVATRMGKTRVAVCQGPDRLMINGKLADLADGKRIELADATVMRQGNVYLITGQSGDSVRAQLNPGYIDVNVGLARWPDTVLGLLGNGRDASEIVARDGTVLTEPVNFQDLYFKFGDSWRVPASESLLCPDPQVDRSNPPKPFCVTDLDPKTRDHAQGVCLQFGVKQGPLLDACTLDVAMLGDGAARGFVGAIPPVVVGTAGCR